MLAHSVKAPWDLWYWCHTCWGFEQCIFQLHVSVSLCSRIKRRNESIRFGAWQHLEDSASERCPVTVGTFATAFPKIVLSSPSIHQWCGWLPRYKQLPLQLGLMTQRGRQICSLGSSYLLFINLLSRHLTLLHQSCRAPARAPWPCLPARDWLRCSTTAAWPTSVAGGPGHALQQQTWTHCHRFCLQRHPDETAFPLIVTHYPMQTTV